MAFPHHYLLFLPLCILYVESAHPSSQLCNENSTTTTPQITKNIDSVLAKLVQSTYQSSHSTTSFGSGPTRVFGLAQCRGDVSSEVCSTCIQTAAREIKTICPNRVHARLWYEYCLIRYNTENFFDRVDTGYKVIYASAENVTESETFNRALGELMYGIDTLAAAPRGKGVGVGESNYLSDFVTLYALSQCTEDLSPFSCRQCLEIGNEESLCDNKKGCSVIYNSCFFRYELYPFF